MIFVTSDTHFCHEKEFLWKNRGFSSVEDMNEALVKRWNKVVKNTDTVYHLGDMMITDDKKGLEYVKRLHGKIILIVGNHDTEVRLKLLASECKIEGLALRFKYNQTPFYISHFPTITATMDKKAFPQHIIGLHGHTHNKTPWIDPGNPFMYDVGVDAHNFTPVSLTKVIADVKQKWEKIK
jgi:calcineurin-like phosphoesterase family protein